MLCIGTSQLAIVPRKSYQFNKPTHTADVPLSSTQVSIVLHGKPTRSRYT